MASGGTDWAGEALRWKLECQEVQSMLADSERRASLQRTQSKVSPSLKMASCMQGPENMLSQTRRLVPATLHRMCQP